MLYSRLLSNCLYLKMRGLSPYFKQSEAQNEFKIRSFKIVKSSHKTAAIEAIQNTLIGQGIAPRLSRAVAQSTDELLLNAIFDAPADKNGKRYRHREPRESNFELTEREEIQIEFALGPGYAGISVADQFGSIERARLFSTIRSHLQADSKSDAATGNAGFGVHGIIRSGISLKILSQPGVRTEAMLFFPLVQDFRQFRNGFKFFSLLATD